MAWSGKFNSPDHAILDLHAARLSAFVAPGHDILHLHTARAPAFDAAQSTGISHRSVITIFGKIRQRIAGHRKRIQPVRRPQLRDVFAMSANVKAYIEKPFDPKTLRQKISESLAKA